MAQMQQQTREQEKLATAQSAYYQRLTKKKPKEPYRSVMQQLCDLGYTDYDKNWKIVKKDSKPDISKILDKLNTGK